MPSPSIHQAVNQPTLLPVVRRVILQLDQLYLEFSHLGDAVDRGRLAELYGQWLSAGRTGPSGLRFYAQALGAALPEGAHVSLLAYRQKVCWCICSPAMRISLPVVYPGIL